MSSTSRREFVAKAMAVGAPAVRTAWGQQSVSVQSAILSIGWPVLYLVTVLQTLFMIKKLFRRQRGFTV